MITLHIYEYHFNTPNQNPALGNSNNAGGDYYFTYGDTLIMNLNSNNKNAAQHAQFMEETIAARSRCKMENCCISIIPCIVQQTILYQQALLNLEKILYQRLIN